MFAQILCNFDGEHTESFVANPFDDDQIAVWAYDATYVMQKAGILNGLPDSRFALAATASRAEVVQMFKNFMEMVIK